MADDRCPACGALYALVGYRHNCRGVAAATAVTPVTVPAVKAVPVKVVSDPVRRGGSTHRYRDRAEWAGYMRGYRARRRGVV